MAALANVQLGRQQLAQWWNPSVPEEESRFVAFANDENVRELNGKAIALANSFLPSFLLLSPPPFFPLFTYLQSVIIKTAGKTEKERNLFPLIHFQNGHNNQDQFRNLKLHLGFPHVCRNSDLGPSFTALPGTLAGSQIGDGASWA